MNKKTKALTTEQYREIITTMKEGACGFRPNERIATALVLEGNKHCKDGIYQALAIGLPVFLSYFAENKSGKKQEAYRPLALTL